MCNIIRSDVIIVKDAIMTAGTTVRVTGIDHIIVRITDPITGLIISRNSAITVRHRHVITVLRSTAQAATAISTGATTATVPIAHLTIHSSPIMVRGGSATPLIPEA